ncbi:MAG: OmpA family protein, partial [Bacteroidota bacterium]|nr:OmpA family protein [Bacteroidota bacterium]
IEKNEFKLQKKGANKALKNIKYGDFYYEQNTQGTYERAIKYYLIAFQYNPNNPELNYKIGICYIKSVMGFESLEYLQKAFDTKNNVAYDIEYFLARAYHLNKKFNKAIEYYTKYKSNVANDPMQIIDIDKKIKECQSGKVLVAKPIIVRISTPENINSSDKDYASLISADGSNMYFSSRRPNTTGDIDPNDGQYFEDIYSSKKDSIKWSKPKNVRGLNTPGHDDVVGLSQDGNTLILYKNGDLFFSKLKGDRWSIPKAFPKEINSKQIESSACFSPDGNILYFVRGKNPIFKESNGDIYYSKLNKDNEWTEAVKLPDNINSPYDEDGIFMFADGKTLYFSSKGHNSMGGYDIFKTTLIDSNTFSNPVNLGYPINSPDNDIYFVLAANNITGYFTSVRQNSKGYTDIYSVNFFGQALFLNSEDNLIASIASPIDEINPENKVVVVIKGKIVNENTGEPLNAEILIVDNKTNKIIFRTQANSKDGSYSVSIPVGKNYGMVINKDGYMFHSENFDLVSENNYQEIEKDISISNIEVNKKVTLSNIFFEFASSTIQTYSFSELERIVEFMKKNPTIKVEISGHTDNVGDKDKNIQLSKERAKVVANYLIQKGIK